MDDENNDRRWYDYTRAGETAAAFAGFIESMAQSEERSGNLERAAYLYGSLVRIMGPRAWSDQAQGWELEYLLQEKRLRDEIERRRIAELHAEQDMVKLLAWHTYIAEN